MGILQNDLYRNFAMGFVAGAAIVGLQIFGGLAGLFA